jgi:hypothetical protein
LTLTDPGPGVAYGELHVQEAAGMNCFLVPVRKALEPL